MPEPLVKTDNDLVWDGVKKPFFELYHVHLSDTNGRWALFLEFAINNPDESGRPGMSSVSACFADQNGEHLALRRDYDLSTHDIVHADEFIHIDNTSLSLADCAGGIQEGKRLVKWELAFEDPVLSFRPYSSLWFNRLPFMPTKILLPRLVGFVSGNIFVDHRKFALQRARMSQLHVYGTSFAKAWSRASCLNFQEDSEAFFEAQSCQVRFRDHLIRPLSLFYLGMEGRIFRADSLWHMACLNKSEVRKNLWQAVFQKDGYRFDCRITRATEAIRREFFGPSGEACESVDGLMADVEIHVSRKQHGLWRDYKMLTGARQGVFQTVRSL